MDKILNGFQGSLINNLHSQKISPLKNHKLLKLQKITRNQLIETQVNKINNVWFKE